MNLFMDEDVFFTPKFAHLDSLSIVLEGSKIDNHILLKF